MRPRARTAAAVNSAIFFIGPVFRSIVGSIMTFGKWEIFPPADHPVLVLLQSERCPICPRPERRYGASTSCS